MVNFCILHTRIKEAFTTRFTLENNFIQQQSAIKVLGVWRRLGNKFPSNYEESLCPYLNFYKDKKCRSVKIKTFAHLCFVCQILNGVVHWLGMIITQNKEIQLKDFRSHVFGSLLSCP